MPPNQSVAYLRNTFTQLLTVPNNTHDYVSAALSYIITNYPPRDTYADHELLGLWMGPTALAYLLLNMSQRWPLQKPELIRWADRYSSGIRSHLQLDDQHCGLDSEILALTAVRAAVTKDSTWVKAFVDHIPRIVHGNGYTDNHFTGRAGTLYMLRMIRHWVPGSVPDVEPSIAAITETIMRNMSREWDGHSPERSIGTAHNDLAILTQLVLTTPTLATTLKPRLTRLMDIQLPDGKWPATPGHGIPPSVAFLHGTAGFVHSLLSLRPWFPDLQQRIDHCIVIGRGCIWREGILPPEPNLSHGIFGTALALPVGSHREHFLAMATPERIAQARNTDVPIFRPSAESTKYSTLAGHHPSAVWTWTVFRDEHAKIITYNDI